MEVTRVTLSTGASPDENRAKPSTSRVYSSEAVQPVVNDKTEVSKPVTGQQAVTSAPRTVEAPPSSGGTQYRRDVDLIVGVQADGKSQIPPEKVLEMRAKLAKVRREAFLGTIFEQNV